MTDARIYLTHLEWQRECPLCGAGSLNQVDDTSRRFECGAVFSFSEIIGGIVASEPCTLASAEAARLMNMRVGKAVAS